MTEGAQGSLEICAGKYLAVFTYLRSAFRSFQATHLLPGLQAFPVFLASA